MTRFWLRLAACAGLGLFLELSGVGLLLPLERLVPPAPPERWSALPSEGRVELNLVASDRLVRGLAAGLAPSEVALHRPGAVALVDGRVFAVGAASARALLRALAWDALPIAVHPEIARTYDRFAAPTPAPLGWLARHWSYQGLRVVQQRVASHPSSVVAAVAAAWVLLLPALSAAASRRPAPTLRGEVTAWRARGPRAPVRVVLVSDRETLDQVRIAIGEEHVIAASEHAFAFAEGWILAVRKGSVFELVSELGWRLRPLEMASRMELVDEGHALSAAAGDDPADTLGLLEALHVCGPVAHGLPPATGVLAPA